MMTYLPVEDFKETAALLRDAELYPSRTDAWKVMQALLGLEDRWKHNPLTMMWEGYEFWLGYYALVMCDEWRRRHGGDSLHERFVRLVQDATMQEIITPESNSDRPWWLGHQGLHLSHQSNLVRLAPDHYSAIWPDVRPGLPFVTPTSKSEKTNA